MPISSPKMTSVLGLRPAAGVAAGAAGAAAGAAFWACANACVVSVAAATIDDEPSNTARRSMAALSPPLESVAVWSRLLASLLILRSLATRVTLSIDPHLVLFLIFLRMLLSSGRLSAAVGGRAGGNDRVQMLRQ